MIFFSSTSRDILERASSRFSFASFQLCLSDKISFFLMLLPLFLTLSCSSCLLALRQPRPSRRRLLVSARATTAASVPCAYSYSCVDVVVVVDVAGAGDFETAAHSLTCNLIFKFILFPFARAATRCSLSHTHTSSSLSSTKRVCVKALSLARPRRARHDQLFILFYSKFD